MNNNELIAEFMGMSSFKTEHDTFWHPNEKCTPENWKYHSLDLDNFYPKSWDWLMPACNKWDDLYKDAPVLIDRSTDTYSEYIELCDKLDNAVTTYEIHNAYLQLVSNIEWYNKQKS